VTFLGSSKHLYARCVGNRETATRRLGPKPQVAESDELPFTKQDVMVDFPDNKHRSIQQPRHRQMVSIALGGDSGKRDHMRHHQAPWRPSGGDSAVEERCMLPEKPSVTVCFGNGGSSHWASYGFRLRRHVAVSGGCRCASSYKSLKKCHSKKGNTSLTLL
jgi:hypothetical protein